MGHFREIENFFLETEISSYEGTLSSLSQLISRGKNTYISKVELLDFFQKNNGLPNHTIEISFVDNSIYIRITECGGESLNQ